MYKIFGLLLTIFCLSVFTAGYKLDDFHERHRGIVLPENMEGQTYELNADESGLQLIAGGKNCTREGLMCEDCKNVSLCIFIGDGWIKEEADVCPDGQTCFEATGECSSSPNPDCADTPSGGKFACRQVGSFPDPYSCSTHHMCTKKENATVVDITTYHCNAGFYYNARTTLCDQKIKNNTCPVIGNPCGNATSFGPVPANPAMYYACLRDPETKKYMPQLLLCSNDQIFSVEQKKCVDPTPSSSLGPDGKCLGVGNFYDPANCMYYFECIAVGAEPSRHVCNNKMYFNPTQRKCVDFTCKNVSN